MYFTPECFKGFILPPEFRETGRELQSTVAVPRFIQGRCLKHIASAASNGMITTTD
jgi:hypothetical protein